MIEETPCTANDREELFCKEHSAFWSRRQDYCEHVLSRHPELVVKP